MKIAIFAWESLHSVAVGEVSTHVTELAAALERRGNEVHVFVRLGMGQSTYDCIDGVHYHRCPIELNSDFVTEMNNMGNAFAYFMAQAEAYQGAHFDVVHGHDWLCAKGIIQAKNDRGRRVVVTYHSTEFGRAGNRGPKFGADFCDRGRGGFRRRSRDHDERIASGRGLLAVSCLQREGSDHPQWHPLLVVRPCH